MQRPVRIIFFFSSRRRHTRWNCDWSSDVCSSDLPARQAWGPRILGVPAPDLMLRERLRVLYPGVSGRRLKEWLAGARVRVNGVVVHRGDSPVGPDDRVELGAPPPAPFPAALGLVHEDEHLLVVDKPVVFIATATA